MLRVIIADDEENVLNLIKNVIDWREFGMEIAGTARNGVEALELIGELDPDLVVTDIRMPGCDGLELIERARAVKESLEFVIISGHRHFEYAQSAIRYGVYDYLLKPIKRDELAATLRKIGDRHNQALERQTKEAREETRRRSEAVRLRTGFLEGLVHGGAAAAGPGMDEINAGCHFNFQPGCFQGFVLKLDYDGDSFGGEAASALCVKLADRLRRALPPDCHDVELLTDGSRVWGIVNYDEADRGKLRKGIKEAMDEAAESWRVKVTAALGGPSASPAGLAASLAQAGSSLPERLVRGTGILIEGNTIPMEGIKITIGATSALQAMETAAKGLDGEGAATAAAEGFDRLAGSPGVTGGLLLAWSRRAFGDAVAALCGESPLLDGLDRLAAEFSAASDLCASAMELRRLLTARIAAAVGEAAEILAQAEKKPVRLAKQYIRDHYRENVTLEDVASRAGFNAAYFSTLFKKESGDNFLEYLTGVRMDKARELLKGTDMTVPAVCAAVGYSDVKHFTRSFKKHTGLRPGEYRRMFS